MSLTRRAHHVHDRWQRADVHVDVATRIAQIQALVVVSQVAERVLRLHEEGIQLDPGRPMSCWQGRQRGDRARAERRCGAADRKPGVFRAASSRLAPATTGGASFSNPLPSS